MIGHISIAMRMVGDKLRGLPDFPPLLRSLVEHMILSHHGKLEFGSPKVPQFPEALLLHYLDDLDSKMESMRAQIENDRQVEGCFTSYNPALDRAALEEGPLSESRGPPRTRLRQTFRPLRNPRAAASPAARPRPVRPPWQATLSWQRNSCRPGSSVPRQTDAQDRARCASTSGTGLSQGALDACRKATSGPCRKSWPSPARLAYTTIMTVLDRLVRKGKLTRRKVGRAFVYSPQASRDSMRRAALRELVDGFFDGSEAALLEFLRPIAVAAPSTPPPPHEEHQIDTVLL